MSYSAKVFCWACIHTTVFGFSPITPSTCIWCASNGGHHCWFWLRCFASNRHSLVATSCGIVARRGFLPRGLYDTHPSLVIAAPLARQHGRASYKPKLLPTSATHPPVVDPAPGFKSLGMHNATHKMGNPSMKSCNRPASITMILIAHYAYHTVARDPFDPRVLKNAE